MKQEETLPKYLHYANLLHKAQAQKHLQFNESNVLIDTINRNTPIQKALVYKKIDAVIILETNKRSINLLSAMSNQAIPGISSGTSQANKLIQTIELPLPNQAYILSATMNEEDGIIGLTSTEGLIYFYKYNSQISKFRLFKIICCCSLFS